VDAENNMNQYIIDTVFTNHKNGDPIGPSTREDVVAQLNVDLKYWEANPEGPQISNAYIAPVIDGEADYDRAETLI
jgi:hypothetical protein